MNIRYSVVNWEFNKGAWAQAVQAAIADVGYEFVAQVVGVSPKTVQNWSKMPLSAYDEFPYPNMTNFIRFCNEFDKDVRDFFILEDI